MDILLGKAVCISNNTCTPLGDHWYMKGKNMAIKKVCKLWFTGFVDVEGVLNERGWFGKGKVVIARKGANPEMRERGRKILAGVSDIIILTVPSTGKLNKVRQLSSGNTQAVLYFGWLPHRLPAPAHIDYKAPCPGKSPYHLLTLTSRNHAAVTNW